MSDARDRVVREPKDALGPKKGKFRCDFCGKTRREVKKMVVDTRPREWFWLRATRDNLMDGCVRPAWCLGEVAARRDFARDTLLFVIVPVNTVVDFVARLHDWCRYRKPSKMRRALKASYQSGYTRGLSDGREGNLR